MYTSTIPWSLRAVKRMEAVSSPTRHSAMRVFRRCGEAAAPFCSTVLELTTFTTSVWPLVPGFRLSTFTKTGFLKPRASLAAIFLIARKNRTLVRELCECSYDNSNEWLTVCCCDWGSWVLSYEKFVGFRLSGGGLTRRLMAIQLLPNGCVYVVFGSCHLKISLGFGKESKKPFLFFYIDNSILFI